MRSSHYFFRPLHWRETNLTAAARDGNNNNTRCMTTDEETTTSLELVHRRNRNAIRPSIFYHHVPNAQRLSVTWYYPSYLRAEAGYTLDKLSVYHGAQKRHIRRKKQPNANDAPRAPSLLPSAAAVVEWRLTGGEKNASSDDQPRIFPVLQRTEMLSNLRFLCQISANWVNTRDLFWTIKVQQPWRDLASCHWNAQMRVPKT